MLTGRVGSTWRGRSGSSGRSGASVAGERVDDPVGGPLRVRRARPAPGRTGRPARRCAPGPPAGGAAPAVARAARRAAPSTARPRACPTGRPAPPVRRPARASRAAPVLPRSGHRPGVEPDAPLRVDQHDGPYGEGVAGVVQGPGHGGGAPVDPDVPAGAHQVPDHRGPEQPAGGHDPRGDPSCAGGRGQHHRVDRADVVGGQDHRPAAQRLGQVTGDPQPGERASTRRAASWKKRHNQGERQGEWCEGQGCEVDIRSSILAREGRPPVDHEAEVPARV